ncbi:fimbrial protein [Pseudomonas sp. RIT-PI-S]|uniref:fimbrial protein n=1 Tax=Pseudomonas sp. RIT-PI-S TaxID=3035295 RepID=UPI0021DAB03E|nr:fimbrial protein [Pseudomonas sp. RIT-PI-S]
MKYLALPLALLLAGQAVAADNTVSKRIQVTALVPTAVFSFLDEHGWMNETQKMALGSNGNLEGIVGKRVLVRSTTGAISARLESEAVLTSRGDRIPLTITANGVDLSNTSQEVVSAADAANRFYMNMDISAADGPYAPGNYMAFVDVTFETPLGNVTP